jgi:hypothetical protein
MEKDSILTSDVLSSNSSPVKTGIGDILGETWTIYKKNFKVFTLIFILPTAAIVALQEFIGPSMLNSMLGKVDKDALGEQLMKFQGPVITAMLVAILMAIAVSAVQFITYGAMLRACGSSEGGNASAGESFSFSMGRFWQGIILSVKIFFYSMAWLIFIAIIPIVVFAVGALLGSVASGAGEKLPAGLEWITGMGFLAGIAPILMIVIAVVVIIRSLRVTFAFPMLFGDEKITPKEALRRSIELSQGLGGTIFLNYFLLGIIFAVIGGIYGAIMVQLAMAFIPSQSAFSVSLASVNELKTQLNQIMAVLTLPLAVFSGSFGIIFQYAFMKKAMEEKKPQWDTMPAPPLPS